MDAYTWRYNDGEFELDMRDVEQVERYENAVELLREEDGEIESGLKASERLRAQCGCIERFFERVFGRDAAKALFGKRLNLGEHNDAYFALLDFVAAQGEAEQKRIAEKMSSYMARAAKAKAKGRVEK